MWVRVPPRVRCLQSPLAAANVLPAHAVATVTLRWLARLAQNHSWASRVHSSVVRAADCRSAGPWFKSGCALLRQRLEDAEPTCCANRERTSICIQKRPTENEGREIRTPNLLIWSQTRCRCAIPPMRSCFSYHALWKQTSAATPMQTNAFATTAVILRCSHR